MSGRISYTVQELRAAAWDALHEAKCLTCGARAIRSLDGDRAWTLETRPGLSVRVVGRCKGKDAQGQPLRHTLTASCAI